MIRIFFNGDGYFVSGEGVEVSRRCSPALTEKGDPVFQSIHHQYKILYLALTELRHLHLKEDVVVYNDSRIIDEILGYVEPLDVSCTEWLNIIRRHAIPRIKSVVFFRKKSSSEVSSSIQQMHECMLKNIDERCCQQLVDKEVKARASVTQDKKRSLLQRFKKAWLGE